MDIFFRFLIDLSRMDTKDPTRKLPNYLLNRPGSTAIRCGFAMLKKKSNCVLGGHLIQIWKIPWVGISALAPARNQPSSMPMGLRPMKSKAGSFWNPNDPEMGKNSNP